MILEIVHVGSMQVNCYILAVAKDSKAIIIDPGDNEHKIIRALNKYSLTPAFVINTHGHYDHIGCDDKFGVPVFVHKEDASLLTDPMLNLSGLYSQAVRVKAPIRTLGDNEIIELGEIQLKVLHVPGHTAGGIALLLKKPKDKILFTGDTLFCQGIGRSDLSGGSESLLMKSIKERLLIFPDDTVIYPGHGEPSTIGDEKRSNPFLM